MKGIILAAGYATRLYPLTINKAKALLPVHGRPIIDHIVDEMNTLPDLDQIFVVSNHRFAGQFEAWATARRRTAGPGEIPLAVIDDRTLCEEDRLGAIGDVQYCLDQLKIDEDLLIIAGDNLFTYRLRDAWAYFCEHGDDTVLGCHMPADADLRRFAVAVLDSEGRIVNMIEKPAEPPSDIAVFATYFYRQDTLPLIRAYLESGHSPDAPGNFPVWLYPRKTVRCYLFDGVCIDIGTPESYAAVESIFPMSVTGEQSAVMK